MSSIYIAGALLEILHVDKKTVDHVACRATDLGRFIRCGLCFTMSLTSESCSEGSMTDTSSRYNEDMLLLRKLAA